MNLATAFVEVRGKTDKLKPDTVKAATEAGKAAGDALDKGIETGIKSGTTKGRTALQGITDVFKGALFVGGIKTAISAASDLNETVSKTQVVFGAQAKAIQAFGDTAAKNLGQSKQEALDAAANFAIFAKSAGLTGDATVNFSTKLTTLAGDLASFSNTSPQDAITALSAALRGESEPIRQYGVLLDDASLRQEAMRQGLIATTTQALTPQQRVLAAYQLILNQTTLAQGDFARTADGAANSQRISAAESKNAAASLGENFLPIYTKAVQLVGVLAEGFGALPGPIQLGIVALAGIVAFSGPIGTTIELVKQVGPAIAKGFSTALAGIGAVSPAFLALAAVAAIATAALILFGNQESESDKIAKNLDSSLRETAKSFDEQVLAAGTATGTLQGYANQLEEVNQKQIKSTIESKHQVDDLNRLGLTYQELGKLTGSQGEREAELTKLRTQLISSGEVYIASTNDLSKAATLSASSQQAVNEEFIRTGSVTNDVVDGQKLILQGNTELNGSYNDLAEGAAKSTQQLIEQAGAGDVAAAKVLQARGDLGLLTDAQLKNAQAALAAGTANTTAAGGITQAGTAAKVAISTFTGLSSQTSTIKDQMDAAAKAADEFKNALDRLIGGGISLSDATNAAIESEQGLSTAFADARKAVKDHQGSLDENSQAGRDNQKVIKDSIQAELDYVDAFVQSGGSQAEASQKLSEYTSRLVDQAVQSGLSKDEVEAYIAQLNLTPANVNTAIALANQEIARNEAAGWIKTLQNTDGTGIPKEVISTLKAQIEAGSEEALGRMVKLIQYLKNNQTVVTRVTSRVDPGGGGLSAEAAAAALAGNPDDHNAGGSFIPNRTIRELGEAGPEVVLNNQQAAKILWDQANGVSAGGGPGKSVAIHNHFYGDINGVDDWEARMDARDRELVTALGAV